MSTAEPVIRDILQEILIQSPEMKVKGVDSSTAIRYMNRYMSQIDAGDGISLGYTEVTSLADPITIPEGAINGLILNTALYLLTSYDIQPNQHLIINAKEAKNAMRKIARKPRVTAMPSTLPLGSGNQCYDDFNNTRYFPGPDPSILDEQNGHILLEDDTDVD